MCFTREYNWVRGDYDRTKRGESSLWLDQKQDKAAVQIVGHLQFGIFQKVVMKKGCAIFRRLLGVQPFSSGVPK